MDIYTCFKLDAMTGLTFPIHLQCHQKNLKIGPAVLSSNDFLRSDLDFDFIRIDLNLRIKPVSPLSHLTCYYMLVMEPINMVLKLVIN